MNINEARRLRALEAEANAKGIPLWQREMADAVDDRLISDLQSDALRNRVDPNGPEVATLIARENRLRAEEEREAAAKKKFDEDVITTIITAGINIHTAPECVHHWAANILKEHRGNVSTAAPALHKRFPDL